MNKDYYQTLELNKYATKDEIKKNYKKLALKYHPDKNNNCEISKIKFQDITEAYSVLNDDEKRKRYDKFGIDDNDILFDEDPFKMFNSIFKEHLHQFQNMNYENNFDINNIINELSGININNIFELPKVHVKVHTYNNDISSFNNIIHEINNFDKFNTMNNFDKFNINVKNDKNDKKKQTKIEELIDDIVIHIDTDMKEIYERKKKEIIYEKNKYKKGKIVKKNISLKINLFDKEIILHGNGNEDENNKGNVIIYIHNQNKYFTRINEYDVLYQCDISFKDYYSNHEMSIKLPNEEIIYLKNVEGNKYIKINKKGIPYLKEDKLYYGDLYCIFCIQMPDIDNVYNIVNDLIENDINDLIENNDIKHIDNTNKIYNIFKYVKYNDVFLD